MGKVFGFRFFHSAIKTFLGKENLREKLFYRAVKSCLKFKVRRDIKSIWHQKFPPENIQCTFPLHEDKVKKAFKPFVYLHSELPSTTVEINFPSQNEIFASYFTCG